MIGEEQKEVWNGIAEEWNKFRQKQMSEVVEFLEDKKGNILDLGCGSGRHLIKNPNLKFYEVDFSDEMIKFARLNAEEKQIEAEFFISSLENLPFEDNFFDSAIFIAALHCISDKEKREKSLRELFRVLKSGVEVLITVWSKNHPKLINHPKDATISWKTKTGNLHRYYYLYDMGELQNLLEKTRFEIISIEEDDKNILALIKKP